MTPSVNSPVVIIGPSGAGKSSIVKLLCDHYGFHLIKTVTTRPQRDAFDTDHEFITPEIFKSMQENNEFFGILEVFGAQYGLPKFNPSDKTVLLLRAPAIPEFLTRFSTALIIEIDAPLPVLKQRLNQRGTLERFEPDTLSKEIALGTSLAHITYDTSQLTSEEIAEKIAQFADSPQA